MRIWCSELSSPLLLWALHVDLHVFASHMAILGREMILWEVTKVFVMELEPLVHSETWSWVSGGRCSLNTSLKHWAWHSVSVSSPRVPGRQWRNLLHSPQAQWEGIPKPDNSEQGSCLAFQDGVNAWSCQWAPSPHLMDVAVANISESNLGKWKKLSPPPAARVFSFYFCRKELSISPPCHAIQENKKALLTSALFSSYMQALSRLSIKPLPTQRRRQAYAHTSQRTIPPIPREQHLQQWLGRVYFCSSLRLWLTGVLGSNCTYSSSAQPVHRVMAGQTWKLMETLPVGGNGCRDVCRSSPLRCDAQVHLLLPRGVTKETRSHFQG